MTPTATDFARRVRRRLGPRRFHAFGIGPGKSGTHSLASMLSRHYRAAHEPHADEFIDLLLGRRTDPDGTNALRAFLRRQDRMRLEMNASHLNTCVLDLIADEFPEAKFVASVRDCFSWTNSAINQVINNPLPGAGFARWRVTEFGDPGVVCYAIEEAPLKARGIWPLSSYLETWKRYYERVLTVPTNRLLLLHTGTLSSSTHRVAEFLGVPSRTVEEERSHSFAAPVDHGVLRLIDADFVNSEATKSCGPLMERWFPQKPLELAAYL